jgi:hypothetical protein
LPHFDEVVGKRGGGRVREKSKSKRRREERRGR